MHDQQLTDRHRELASRYNALATAYYMRMPQYMRPPMSTAVSWMAGSAAGAACAYVGPTRGSWGAIGLAVVGAGVSTAIDIAIDARIKVPGFTNATSTLAELSELSAATARGLAAGGIAVQVYQAVSEWRQTMSWNGRS